MKEQNRVSAQKRETAQNGVVLEVDMKRALSVPKSTERRGLYKTISCRRQLYL
jgi:hypothetical protein